MWGYISKHNLRGTRPKVPYVPKVYGTFNIPAMLGFKWQMDIKYVEGWRISPKAYQYTMIDEATRRTFEMAYADKSTYSTKDFVKAAIKHFGYMPLIIQTDNGPEFTNRLLATIEAHKINLVDEYLNERHITHKLIPPASPTKNCIVERRHREDERRYKGRPMFADLSNLNAYLKNWCAEKDDTFTFALCPKCHKSPNTRHAELLGELGRFARVELRLRRNPKIQELIYAYCEWERIKAQREIPKVKYIYHLPDGVSLAPDIRCALSRL
jgi:transposase InsO family protein